jgi:hypothetical protein
MISRIALNESSNTENLNSLITSNDLSPSHLPSISPANTATTAAGRQYQPRTWAAPVPTAVTGIVTIDEFLEFLCLAAPPTVSLGYSFGRQQ